MKPARQVVTRSPHRSVGLLAAGAANKMVAHESGLEKVFGLGALALSEVTRLSPQPFRIDLSDAGLDRQTYVPDYRVEFLDGQSCVVEVKPKRFIEKDSALFDAVGARLRSDEMVYLVVSDEHLTPARAKVFALIRRCKKISLPLDLADKAMQLALQPLTWRDALGTGIPDYVWYALIGKHRLFAETPDLYLTANTRLYCSKGDIEHDCQIRFQRWFGCSPWRTNL